MIVTSRKLTPPSFAEIQRLAQDHAPGDSFRIPKSVMPQLPPEFRSTGLGTPLWIAHPGSISQMRAPSALHAYEDADGWEVHRDRFDPKENPIGHFFFDAPELPIASLMAGIAGVLTYWILDDEEKRKPEAERRSWVPIVAAIAVSVIVGVVAYFLLALLRVSLGVG
jgi:hypothetical protein